MAEIGFQVSGKLSDGRIFVIAAENYITFAGNLTDALGEEGAGIVLRDFAAALRLAEPAPKASYGVNTFETPMTVTEVQNAFGATTIGAGTVVMCKHNEPAKFVPAGVSKASGKPYRAFYACARPKDTQCDFRANG